MPIERVPGARLTDRFACHYVADMRRWLAVVWLIGCGNKEPTPPPAPSRAKPPADAARCTTLESQLLSPVMATVNKIAWRSATEVIVAVGDHQRDPAHPDPKGSGISIYDLAQPEGTSPVRYRMPANDIAIFDGKTVLAVGDDRVTAFDLDTHCVRYSEPLEIDAASIDAKRGRVFVVTKNGFVRLDGPNLHVAVDLPRLRNVKTIGYDPTSDRVIARTYSKTVELYDGTTLAPAGVIALPIEPSGGPWVRPGVAEAWFIYNKPCEERQYTHSQPMRMSLGKCIEDPKTVGSFLVRLELPSGKLLQTIQFAGGENGYSEGNGSFSADGKVLLVPSISIAHLQIIDGAATTLRTLSTQRTPHYEWGDGDILWDHMSLDDNGARFASQFKSSAFHIGDTRTGKTLWWATLP